MNKKDKTRKLKISCGTLTYKFGATWENTKILLVKQFSDKEGWGIPKGHINKGETHEQCAMRETLEETGIKVITGERLNDVKVSYRNFDKLVITFLAEQIGNDQPFANGEESEVADAKWFEVVNVPQIYPYQQDIITAGIDKIKDIYDRRR